MFGKLDLTVQIFFSPFLIPEKIKKKREREKAAERNSNRWKHDAGVREGFSPIVFF